MRRPAHAEATELDEGEQSGVFPAMFRGRPKGGQLGHGDPWHPVRTRIRRSPAAEVFDARGRDPFGRAGTARALRKGPRVREKWRVSSEDFGEAMEKWVTTRFGRPMGLRLEDRECAAFHDASHGLLGLVVASDRVHRVSTVQLLSDERHARSGRAPSRRQTNACRRLFGMDPTARRPRSPSTSRDAAWSRSVTAVRPCNQRSRRMLDDLGGHGPSRPREAGAPPLARREWRAT
jgi:hypothetical protein